MTIRTNHSSRCLASALGFFLASTWIGWPADLQSGAVETVLTFVRALEAADLDRLLGTFDEKATVFMPIAAPASRLSGRAQIRQAFDTLFKRAGATGAITPRDISVQEFGDTAIVTMHLRDIPALPIQEPVIFPRRTFILRRTRNRWLIVHLHASNLQIPRTAQ